MARLSMLTKLFWTLQFFKLKNWNFVGVGAYGAQRGGRPKISE